MLDIKFIRENRELVREAARKKRLAFDLDELLRLDEKRRELLGKVETARGRQNETNKKIAAAANELERGGLIKESQNLKLKTRDDEEELKDVLSRWQKAMLTVPNVPDISVPEGETDKDNREERTWGEKPDFSFPARNHIEIMTTLGLADFERGAKVSGFRGYILSGPALELCFALWRLTADRLTRKGFRPYLLPALARRESFLGTGYLPQGEDDLYKTQDGEYLVGTAEVPLMGSLMDEVISKEELPKRMFGFSPCFRREAGAYGRDTKGLVRVHEFFKVEQVIICEAKHEESVRLHEEMTKNAEELVQALELPYRVVVNCGADLGLGQVKKYDIEVWSPAEKRYIETHSSSYFHDFQTRRLNIRYRDGNGVLEYAHSLNNTGLATPRILVPLMENHQREDGSVSVPAALRPYLGGREFFGPEN